MKVNITKRLGDYKDVVGWALLAAVTYASEKSQPPHMGIPKELSPDEDGCLDVQFTVNGVEIPFEMFMERWERHIDESVRRKAGNLLEDKFSKITNVLYYLEREVKSKSSELFPDEDW